ncbi:hypothetical protein MKUB_48210 [Mycobacterium kubicae]|uniref:Uncharacterized protein n=1 Tax=Mycobacterium kubicae TaxID=120959 RepID=A0ABQ1BUL8_9MYCO|nr:hypothetical protein MKUB_48210 [Mycobacterium kubicae]
MVESTMIMKKPTIIAHSACHGLPRYLSPVSGFVAVVIYTPFLLPSRLWVAQESSSPLFPVHIIGTDARGCPRNGYGIPNVGVRVPSASGRADASLKERHRREGAP